MSTTSSGNAGEAHRGGRERADRAGRLARLVVVESFRSFFQNEGMQRAATLTFFGFLALMPMLLLLVVLLGVLADSSEEAMRAMRVAMRSVLPTGGDALIEDVRQVAGRRALGIAGLLLLAWSMTPLAAALHASLERAFATPKKLSLVRGKLRDLLAAGFLLAVFLALSASRVYLGSLAPAWAWTESVIAPILSVAVLSLFFRVFSPIRLAWSDALVGGGTAALLLMALRPLFAILLQANPGFGYAFGSLKAMFLLLVWVHYLFVTLLFAAEVMANWHRREALLLRRVFLEPGRTPDPLAARFLSFRSAGDVLFREGDPGSEMYHVVSGTVDLVKGGITVKRAVAGERFGEMSLLMGAPRTADAIIANDAQLVVIDGRNFETILRENPAIVFDLLREMSRRLRDTTERATARGPDAPA